MVNYYESPEDVIHFDWFTRFLARIFGAKHFVIRCEDCNKIPSEVIKNKCCNCYESTKTK